MCKKHGSYFLKYHPRSRTITASRMSHDWRSQLIIAVASKITMATAVRIFSFPVFIESTIPGFAYSGKKL